MKQRIKTIIAYVLVIWFMMCVIGFITMFADVYPEPSFILLFFPFHICWNFVFFAIALVWGRKILGEKTSKFILWLMFLFLLTTVVSYFVFMPYNNNYYEYEY